MFQPPASSPAIYVTYCRPPPLQITLLNPHEQGPRVYLPIAISLEKIVVGFLVCRRAMRQAFTDPTGNKLLYLCIPGLLKLKLRFCLHAPRASFARLVVFPTTVNELPHERCAKLIIPSSPSLSAPICAEHTSRERLDDSAGYTNVEQHIPQQRHTTAFEFNLDTVNAARRHPTLLCCHPRCPWKLSGRPWRQDTRALSTSSSCTQSGRGGFLRRVNDPQTPRSGTVCDWLWEKPGSLLLGVAASSGRTYPWWCTKLAPAGVHLDI